MKVVLQSMTAEKNKYTYSFIVTSFSATSSNFLIVKSHIERFISIDNFKRYYENVEHHYKNDRVGTNLKITRDMIIDKYVFQFQSENLFLKTEFEM